jgi:hypothetical protein
MNTHAFYLSYGLTTAVMAVLGVIFCLLKRY